MIKRLLSIFLSLCIMLTLLPTVAFAVSNYNIWVGGTQVTVDNASNVTGTGITGTVTYDANTNTLTLDGAAITGYYTDGNSNAAGIYATNDLKISLQGSNTINVAPTIRVAGVNSLNGALTLSGDGSLSITLGTSLQYSVGIRASTTCSITGCTVTTTGGTTTGSDNANSRGIGVNGSLSIENATVIANGGSAPSASSWGIGADGLSIINSTVTATGDTQAVYRSGIISAPDSAAIASTDKEGTGTAAVTVEAASSATNTYKYVNITPAAASANEARWGVAGSEGSAPATWTSSGTLVQAMTYANGLSGSTAYIQLQCNVNTTAPLDFTSTAILDLKGHDIDRGLTAANEVGYVIKVTNALTLKDSSTAEVESQGSITGGNNSDVGGGGIFVSKTGNFTMQGGNITGNKSTSPSCGGGGVYVIDGGNFTMQGGSIADNEALYWGGGIYASGEVTMTGGSITGNKSVNGGIYIDSSFTVGGTAVIQNNTVTGSTTECNVKRVSRLISVSAVTPLTSGASIGITSKTAPTSGSSVNITSPNTDDYSAYFISDDSSYAIQNGTNNVLQLAVIPTVTIGPLSISGTFTAGAAINLSDLDSYKPTVTATGGATITAQGWQSSVSTSSSDNWSNWSMGELQPTTTCIYKLRYYVTITAGTMFTSNAVTLTVVGHATALALAASPGSPQNTGTPVTLTATLTGFFTGPGVNGQAITFKNDGTSLGMANLNASGVASYTWTPTGDGTYTLTAEYAASDYNVAATSSAVSYVINAVDPDIAIVAAAKTAAQGASYADMTQAAATDVDAIKAALKYTAETAVNNDDITVTINQGSYTPPIAGTSADPDGTDGSYTFTVTVSKGGQADTTEQIGIAITATAYTTIPTFNVGGSVTDSTNAALPGASVKLMLGQTQFGSTATTAANGAFAVSGIPNGTYNLVVSKDGIVVTSIITVSNANYAAGTITLPAGRTNSVVEVKDNTPAIVVGNLDAQFATTAADGSKGVTSGDKDAVTGGGSVEIKLTAEEKTQGTASNAANITAAATSNGNTVGIYIDLSVVKTVTTSGGTPTETTLTELPSLIEVRIPLAAALQGKAGYVVYRYHGTAVDTITTTANADGEKIELIDGGAAIRLTIKKFSTYAVGYTPAVAPTGGSGASATSGTITPEQSGNGKITVSTDKKSAAITPDDGYVIADVLVDGKSVGATEKYTFTDSGSHKIAAVFVKNTALPYYLQNDAKVYIGFSAIAENLYKYAAPNGIDVEFEENPKNFTDNTTAWAKPSIDFVTKRELFLGTGENTFSPNEAMTRAMFVTVIGRLYERSYGSLSGTSTFSDVDTDAYYAKYVAWASENGIIKGVGENKFAPEENVTREQMAVIMQSLATFLKKADAADVSLAYPDSASISSWAIDGAKYCQQTQVIAGRDGGSFAPQDDATRAEVAAVIERFIYIIVE